MPDGALRVDPRIPEVIHGHRPRPRQNPLPATPPTSPTRPSVRPIWTASAATTPSCAAGSRPCWRPMARPVPGPRSPGHRRIPIPRLAESPEATLMDRRPKPCQSHGFRSLDNGLATVGATGVHSHDGTLAEVTPVARPRRVRPRPGHRRAVHAARSPRRRAAWARSTWPSRPSRSSGLVALKLIKVGMDSRTVPGPVRRRTTGPGDDGPPQHRRVYDGGVDRRRPALLRDGVRPGRPDHRLLRRAPAARSTPGSRIVRRRLPGGAARAPEGDHPPRPEALQRAGHRGTTAGPRPRSSTSASPRPPSST